MLLQYSVSNFKSIGHMQTLSMMVPESNDDGRAIQTIITKKGNWKVLLRAGIFGPNASGKTSLIESLGFSSQYITTEKKSGSGTGINQFRGNIEDLEGFSDFQYIFYIEGEVYDYGFSMNTKRIAEEWLFQLTKDDFVPVFTRETDEKGKTKIDIFSKFGNRNTKRRQLAEVLKESIQTKQQNQLFLTKLKENGIDKAEKIIEWFEQISVIFPGSKFRALPLKMIQNKELEEFIGGMLRKMDTGVLETFVEKDKIDLEEYQRNYELPSDLMAEIMESKSGILQIGDEYFLFSDANEGKVELLRIQLKHRLNQKVISLNIEDESDGTRRLLDLLPILFLTRRSSSLFCVDEIDRSLHTKLSHYLLSEFAEHAKDMGNQIIFTAHDVNLINLNLFNQAEIWFVEKTDKGETMIRPMSDFQVKKGTDTIKAYLNGRFGAIPVILEE